MTRILVVDDMAIFREPIAAALRLQGFRVLTARNGIEALAQVREELPALILLDIAMPEMDGLELLRQLKASSEYGRIPVILLTAVRERGYVVEAVKLGVRDYMLKSSFSLDQ